MVINIYTSNHPKSGPWDSVSSGYNLHIMGRLQFKNGKILHFVSNGHQDLHNMGSNQLKSGKMCDFVSNGGSTKILIILWIWQEPCFQFRVQKYLESSMAGTERLETGWRGPKFWNSVPNLTSFFKEASLTSILHRHLRICQHISDIGIFLITHIFYFFLAHC